MTEMLLRYARPRARSRIRVAAGALDQLGAFTRRVAGAGCAVIVSDERVAALYAQRALDSLRRAGTAATLVTVPHGERSKQLRTLDRLWSAFGAAGLARRDAVVALGGGVVGDLAGFAAATWMRGVRWVGVPTTVVAQVDSSVGGKTGIDLASGKNLAGAFHQPEGVLVDPMLLQTLPERERRAGLAEVVKMAMACDAELFRWSERHAGALAAGESAALGAAVVRAIRVKAAVVTRDEREREGGGRTALNFGHTLGHAIEAARGYRGMRHGEAVAVGMRVAAALSVREAGLSQESRERLDGLLDRLDLPRRIPDIPLDRLLEAMRHDKKRGGAPTARSAPNSRARPPRGSTSLEPRWVLTTRVGHASVPRLISGRLVRAALLEAGARA